MSNTTVNTNVIGEKSSIKCNSLANIQVDITSHMIDSIETDTLKLDNKNKQIDTYSANRNGYDTSDQADMDLNEQETNEEYYYDEKNEKYEGEYNLDQTGSHSDDSIENDFSIKPNVNSNDPNHGSENKINDNIKDPIIISHDMSICTTINSNPICSDMNAKKNDIDFINNNLKQIDNENQAFKTNKIVSVTDSIVSFLFNIIF
jgi:hypothetical protein